MILSMGALQPAANGMTARPGVVCALEDQLTGPGPGPLLVTSIEHSQLPVGSDLIHLLFLIMRLNLGLHRGPS